MKFPTHAFATLSIALAELRPQLSLRWGFSADPDTLFPDTQRTRQTFFSAAFSPSPLHWAEPLLGFQLRRRLLPPAWTNKTLEISHALRGLLITTQSIPPDATQNALNYRVLGIVFRQFRRPAHLLQAVPKKINAIPAG